MSKKQGKVIGIVGAPGSGKTSLGRRLAQEFNMSLFEETWQKNPLFLGKHKDVNGFELETIFLLLRCKQNQKAKRAIEKGEDVILDTIYFMSDAYASEFLTSRQYKNFKIIFDRFCPDALLPDIIVYLHAPRDVLYDRILKERKNNSSQERKQTSINGISNIDTKIRKYLDTVEHSNIIVFDTHHNDLRNEKNYKNLANNIIDLRRKIIS